MRSDLFNRYPDCQPVALLSAYAKYADVNPNQLITTRGADEGIELLIRAFCTPNESSVLICPPTYGMYAISAQTFGVDVKKAPLQSNFSLDLNTIKRFVGQVNLVFLCSPNNPTGTSLPLKDIEAVLKMYEDQAIVVLDEAYIEFNSEQSKQALLTQYPNLVILRTLSKGFALAGIRCGFVISSKDIQQVLMKVIAPYPIADPVAQIAKQALSDSGIKRMQNRVSTLNSYLQDFTQALSHIKQIEIVGSQCGNFVLFRSEHNAELMKYLVNNNILIRDQSKQFLLEKCLRVSIGNANENNQLLALIQAFFSQAEYQKTGNNQSNQETVS